jgi:hypothetical protein
MACQIRTTVVVVVVLRKNKEKQKSREKKMLSASPLHASIWAEDPRVWLLIYT